MAAMKKRDIRMTDELWKQLEVVSQRFGVKRSLFVRDMLSDVVAEWTFSPYVANSSRHLFVLTAEGDAYYRATESIELNSSRERLPSLVQQKLEKRRDYERHRPENTRTEEWLKQQWLINHFAVWDGGDIEAGRELAAHTDRDGSTEKIADLLVKKGEGTHLTREVLIGLASYPQWMGASPGSHDWVDIPVDIPTQNLEIGVLVDEALYPQIGSSGSNAPSLRIEFRNRESARFLDREILGTLERRPTETVGSFPNDKQIHPDSIKYLDTEFSQLQRRLLELGSARASDGRPIVEDPQALKTIESLALPKRFLFLHASWPTPHLGIVVCVRWQKPKRK